jgi:hypothetical protein
MKNVFVQDLCQPDHQNCFANVAILELRANAALAARRLGGGSSRQLQSPLPLCGRIPPSPVKIFILAIYPHNHHSLNEFD